MPAVGIQESPQRLSAETRAILHCARCSRWMRPHVLWFDECYDEAYYRSESAMEAARSATLLVTVGTTGATTLPLTIGLECRARGAAIVDVNIDDNPFAGLARERGVAVRATAVATLPRMVAQLGVPVEAEE
jgi:NAD-dependent deacetylase